MTGARTSRTFSRTVLALGLCLLAFGFAMEAKLACYRPAGVSGSSDIAAAKARPADLPEVVAHGAHAPAPVDSQISTVALPVITAALLWKPHALLGGGMEFHPLYVSSAASFSSHLFFRPPPIR